MQKITPCLWFDGQAEEAVGFYQSIFPGTLVSNIVRANGNGKGEGTVLTIAFHLFGQDFLALNGGPHFRFNEAVSFVVNCKEQEEIDFFWDKLTEGGTPSRCGWLKDRFGLSWQVVPIALPSLLANTDSVRRQRVLEVLLQMDKIEIARLEAANEGQ